MSSTTLRIHDEKSTKMHMINDRDFLPLQTILRPILLILKIFGLYHEHGYQSRVGNNCEEKIIIAKKFSPQMLYCICVLALNTANVLRYIPSFWIGYDFISNMIVTRIINLGWFCQCFLNGVFIFRACFRKTNIIGFFEYYNTISTDEIARKLDLKTQCSRFRSFSWIATIISLFMYLFNIASMNYLIFSDTTGQVTNLACAPFPAHPVMLITLVVLNTYLFAVWLFPLVLVISLLYILKCQFQVLSLQLEKLILDEGNKAIYKINEIRMKHVQFTKAVDMLDDEFKFFFAEIYITGIFLCCFVTYNLIVDQTDETFRIVMYAYWLVTIEVIIISTSVFAAKVNEAAHSPLDHIFGINMSKTNYEYSSYVNLFISKLNGPPIGFTTLSLVTITKELLLTLAGVYITYLFLLFQFKV